MRRTLFRYRSFNTEKLNDYSYIHQRIINIEKWKFEAFEGLVYPSSLQITLKRNASSATAERLFHF